MVINLSQKIKKRKIPNKIFIPILIADIVVMNIYYRFLTFDKYYTGIFLGIIGIMILVDAIDRYLDHIRKKWQESHEDLK